MPTLTAKSALDLGLIFKCVVYQHQWGLYGFFSGVYHCLCHRRHYGQEYDSRSNSVFPFVINYYSSHHHFFLAAGAGQKALTGMSDSSIEVCKSFTVFGVVM